MTIEIPEDVTWCFFIVKGVIRAFVPFSQADYHHLMSIMRQSEILGVDDEHGIMFTEHGKKRPFAQLVIYDSSHNTFGPRINLSPDEFTTLIEYLSAVHST